MLDEIEEISQGQSIGHSIEQILLEREEYIIVLRRTMIEVRAGQIPMNLAFVCGVMESIRELSLRIIEMIGLCRSEKAISNKNDIYGNDIIRKISTDIDFLRASPLRKHF